MARYRRRGGRNPSGMATMVITAVTALAIVLLVGNNILTSVGSTVGNTSGTPLESAFTFLGMATTGGTWSSTGIVGILALAAVAGVVLYFVRRALKS